MTFAPRLDRVPIRLRQTIVFRIRFSNQAQDLASADFEISLIDHWKRSPAALQNRDPQIPNIQQDFIGSG